MGMVSIDKEKYERIPSKGGKVRIEYFVPRILIPYTVEGKYNNEKDSFTIEFSYGVTEPDKEIGGDEDVCLMVGKNSKKLTKIVIKNIRKKFVNSVQLTQAILHDVSNAIENKKGMLTVEIEQANFENSKTIVRENAETLVQPFQSAFSMNVIS